jgi:hypothetical protein
MGEFQRFKRRHHYRNPDASSNVIEWKTKLRNILWGRAIEPDCFRFRKLIDAFMLEKARYELKESGIDMPFDEKDMEMIIWLVHKNRVVTEYDIREHTERADGKLSGEILKKYIDAGIFTLFEYHSAFHRRGNTYKLNPMVRNWIRDMYSYSFFTKKMPLNNPFAQQFFKKKRGELNFLKMAEELNKIVDERKKKNEFVELPK